jgi:RNase H-like domain found in reverse transcriptase/Reverse transcriptase (RNA-dependent DNA polymerase)/OTU-like cysteine protease
MIMPEENFRNYARYREMEEMEKRNLNQQKKFTRTGNNGEKWERSPRTNHRNNLEYLERSPPIINRRDINKFEKGKEDGINFIKWMGVVECKEDTEDETEKGHEKIDHGFIALSDDMQEAISPRKGKLSTTIIGINNQNCEVILDTGSSKSIIAKSICDKIGIKYQRKINGTGCWIKGITGEAKNLGNEVAVIDMNINGRTYRHELNVTTGSPELFLIGNDFMNGKPFLYDWSTMKLISKISDVMETPPEDKKFMHLLVQWEDHKLPENEVEKIREEICRLPVARALQATVLIAGSSNKVWLNSEYTGVWTEKFRKRVLRDITEVIRKYNNNTEYRYEMKVRWKKNKKEMDKGHAFFVGNLQERKPGEIPGKRKIDVSSPEAISERMIKGIKWENEERIKETTEKLMKAEEIRKKEIQRSLKSEIPENKSEAQIIPGVINLHRKNFIRYKPGKENDYLKERNLIKRKMRGDGNCLFRSLEDQLVGSPDKYQDMREELVQYYRDNQGLLEIYVDYEELEREQFLENMKTKGHGKIGEIEGNRKEIAETRLKNLARDGVFGGDEMIAAAAEKYQVVIYVHQPELGCVFQFSPGGKEDDLSLSQFHILYTGKCHYDSIAVEINYGNGTAEFKPEYLDDEKGNGYYQAGNCEFEINSEKVEKETRKNLEKEENKKSAFNKKEETENRKEKKCPKGKNNIHLMEEIPEELSMISESLFEEIPASVYTADVSEIIKQKKSFEWNEQDGMQENVSEFLSDSSELSDDDEDQFKENIYEQEENSSTEEKSKGHEITRPMSNTKWEGKSHEESEESNATFGSENSEMQHSEGNAVLSTKGHEMCDVEAKVPIRKGHEAIMPKLPDVIIPMETEAELISDANANEEEQYERCKNAMEIWSSENPEDYMEYDSEEENANEYYNAGGYATFDESCIVCMDYDHGCWKECFEHCFECYVYHTNDDEPKCPVHGRTGYVNTETDSFYERQLENSDSEEERILRYNTMRNALPNWKNEDEYESENERSCNASESENFNYANHGENSAEDCGNTYLTGEAIRANLDKSKEDFKGKSTGQHMVDCGVVEKFSKYSQSGNVKGVHANNEETSDENEEIETTMQKVVLTCSEDERKSSPEMSSDILKVMETIGSGENSVNSSNKIELESETEGNNILSTSEGNTILGIWKMQDSEEEEIHEWKGQDINDQEGRIKIIVCEGNAAMVCLGNAEMGFKNHERFLPYEIREIPIKVTKNRIPGGNYALVMLDDGKDLEMITVTDQVASINICNFSDQQVIFAKGQPVGKLFSVDQTEEMNFGNKGKPDDLFIMEDLGENFPDDKPILADEKFLENTRKMQWNDLLTQDPTADIVRIWYKYKDILPGKVEDLSRALVPYEHEINELPGSKPINKPPTRCSLGSKAKMQETTDKLIKMDIAEISNSPYAAQSRMTTAKGHGEPKFTTNFQPLNNQTLKERYPVPNISRIQKAMKNAEWFCTIDLEGGYNQIPIRKSDQVKTAFITADGLFQYKRVQFGLCNTFATFQKAMDVVLDGLKFRTCIVYMQDIVIYGRSINEAIYRLDEVLERLKRYGLKVNPEKCRMMINEVKILGYRMGTNNMERDVGNMKAITELPVPTNAKELQNFIATVTQYKEFIPGFQTIIYPLNELLKKGREWQWTGKRQEIFEKLKVIMTTEPVMTEYNPEIPIEIRTDACILGIGALLLQEKKIIACISRALNDKEKLYTVTEYEALAIKFACEKFRPYIEGQHVTVYTDHQALIPIFNNRMRECNSQRIKQWLEGPLANYELTLVYKPGKINSDADLLSRNPVGEAPPIGEEEEEIPVLIALKKTANDEKEKTEENESENLEESEVEISFAQKEQKNQKYQKKTKLKWKNLPGQLKRKLLEKEKYKEIWWKIEDLN